jgi:hypothetical protein
MRSYLIGRGFKGALDFCLRCFPDFYGEGLKRSIRLFVLPRCWVKGQKQNPAFGIREWDITNNSTVADREWTDGLYSGRGRSLGSIF